MGTLMFCVRRPVSKSRLKLKWIERRSPDCLSNWFIVLTAARRTNLLGLGYSFTPLRPVTRRQHS